jgi:hypothetical protein
MGLAKETLDRERDREENGEERRRESEQPAIDAARAEIGRSGDRRED